MMHKSPFLTATTIGMILTAVSCDSPTVETDRVAAVEVMSTAEFHRFGAGDTLQLRAIVRDQHWNEIHDQPVTWSSLEPAVATVDQNGLVIGEGPGGSEIRASVEDVWGGMWIQVLGPPVSLFIEPDTLTILRGGAARFMATAQDLYYNPAVVDSFEWISDDTTVATIDSVFHDYDFIAHARARGTGVTEIVATADDLVDSASVTVVTVEFTSLTVADGRSCALSTDGHAYCWGVDERDYFYNGSNFPVQAAPETVFTAIAVGGSDYASLHTCGILLDKSATCWGSDMYGELGNGSDWSAPVAGSLHFIQLALGHSFTCGLTDEGLAHCWGLNDVGQLGAASSEECGFTGKGSSGVVHSCSTTPLAVAGELFFESLTTGVSHACGVTVEGHAYCWGSNAHGELGDGSTENGPTPVRVAPSLSFDYLSAGAGYTCGLTTAGQAYCWGDNKDGQLGNGTNTASNTPVAVSGGVTFLSVSAGGDQDHKHTCGIAMDNSAYCWGANTEGQLGDLSTISRPILSVVAGAMSFSSVYSGAGYSCGMTVEGLAYCWGDNEMGQLGAPVGIRSLQPIRVVGQRDVP
jgi:alpha-tubulin suppressor-like RCC1 family protein